MAEPGNVVALPFAPGVAVGEIIAADVAQLAAEFSDYEVGVAYVTSNSRPDYRYLWAKREGVLIAAPDRAMLAAELRARQARSID